VADTSAVEEGSCSEGVLDATELAPTLGLKVGDDEKKLLSLFSVTKVDRDHDLGVSVSNTKGKSELKNLECSFNFENRGCGSSRVKDRMPESCLVFLGSLLGFGLAVALFGLLGLGLLWVLGCVSGFFGWVFLCIFSCVLGGALRFFDIYNITYKKKKKFTYI
jgi:hypothetical protein